MDYKLPNRPENSNKSTFGKVLNIAGSEFMPGAAYLSSISALKIGCGYVYLYTQKSVQNIVANKTPSIVFVPKDNLLKLLNEVDVISLGCGLGLSDEAKDIFNFVVEHKPQKTPIVIDADGINILSSKKNCLINNLILTPHPKEASRLLDVNLSDILKDIQSSANAIANKYNCIVAIKSHNTVVVDQIGNTYINHTGNSSLAKAGSGDVLTGVITGLIAQEMNCFEATCLGVHLHGLSGKIASDNFTCYSVLPENVIEYLPNAIKYYCNSL